MPKCSKCHRILDSTHFEIKENGDPFANCSICRTKSRNAKAAAANNKIIEEVARLPDVDTVLNEIDTAFQDRSSSPLELKKACVMICPDLQIDNFGDSMDNHLHARLPSNEDSNFLRAYYRDSACTILEDINGFCPYRWTFDEFRLEAGRTGARKAVKNCAVYRYKCCQDQVQDRQNEKHSDPAKHRDRTSLERFACRSELKIKFETIDTHVRVDVTIRHAINHIDYVNIELPPRVREYITQNRWLPLKKIWADIIALVDPPIAFTRGSVRAYQYKINCAEWRRDADPLVSAKLALKAAAIPGGLGKGSPVLEEIELPENPCYEVLGFSVPQLIRDLAGDIEEVLMDSTWNCVSGKWELFVAMGELRGSGIALGWLFVRSQKPNPPAHTKESVLTNWLAYFAKSNHGRIEPDTTLSDKDWSEIGAMTQTWTKASHQLCYWHVLNAVRKRLGQPRVAPGFYDATMAHVEFNFIRVAFVPVGQISGLTLEQRTNEDLSVAKEAYPFIKIRIPARSALLSDGSSPEPSPEAGLEDEALPCDLDFDPSVAPFEIGETRYFEDTDEKVISKNATDYEFCPFVHRADVLRLFNSHFCMHPFFPNSSGKHLTGKEIRHVCVRQMYFFCESRGLREVWAYLWRNWYQPSRWTLWARSSCPSFLSRLRTTMVTENHWMQLKHKFLEFQGRPRLDQAIWIFGTLVVPDFINRVHCLSPDFRLGRGRPLTPAQRMFKESWEELKKRPCGHQYSTDINRWTCTCGNQQYNPNYLCKHLVQKVESEKGPPPMRFFLEVLRYRTMPLISHEYIGNSNLDPNPETSARSKRPRTVNDDSPPPPHKVRVIGTADDEDISDDECEHMNNVIIELEININEGIEALQKIKAQFEERDTVWLKNFERNRINKIALPMFREYLKSIRLVEKTVPVTWPRNREERLISSHTMGHHS